MIPFKLAKEFDNWLTDRETEVVIFPKGLCNKDDGDCNTIDRACGWLSGDGVCILEKRRSARL